MKLAPHTIATTRQPRTGNPFGTGRLAIAPAPESTGEPCYPVSRVSNYIALLLISSIFLFSRILIYLIFAISCVCGFSLVRIKRLAFPYIYFYFIFSVDTQVVPVGTQPRPQYGNRRRQYLLAVHRFSYCSLGRSFPNSSQLISYLQLPVREENTLLLQRGREAYA